MVRYQNMSCVLGDFVPFETVGKEDAKNGIDKVEQIVELAGAQLLEED